MTETGIFAAGCFWGVEAAFRATPGVLDVESGYTGGHIEHPTYEQVCSGTTGHAEAVRVSFDPSQVSYETLLRKFFSIHDPTQLNRQGPDVGSQYRSGIFYVDDVQRDSALRVIEEIAPQFYPRTVVTEVVQASTFWRAEEYHQRYAETHPNVVCHI